MAESAPNAKAVFDRALEIESPAAKEAYLADACGGDLVLRQKVEGLLKAFAEAGSFLETAAPVVDREPQPTADYQEKDERPGAIIAGKYTLVEPIGEGGMGSVWRAKQTEPVKRFVAVKLIKTGMDSKQVLARFEAERQALALMDHPSIAKVLDGGLHERRPYFVMELVKGVPITEYCDAKKLTPQERLELFVPVCQAIQHAHQKGIIHRDIKPSNVLVALYDDKPVVKVIDFGVAKATGGALTESTIDTGFGGVVGTPQYMSPEQATFNNLDIDTRSDVYALGVLLYELLTGSPPFSKKDLETRGLLEMLRVVREEEPPRPSNRLSTADALPTLSANRGTEPKKLTGLLRNDLDWIVMKALEKDRARRYETANGFAADVLRYLAGEAVQAHPPGAAYRVRKFVRRHQAQAIAASLILFALLAGVVGTTLGLLEARRQTDIARAQESEAKTQEAEAVKQAALARKEAAAKELARAEEARQRGVAEAEKTRADEEKRIAQAVKDFLQTKLLAQADTATQANQLLQGGRLAAEARHNPTVRELLDRAAKELAPDAIEANFPVQPLVQAEILKTVGDTYRGVGEAATGLPFLTRSVDLFKARLGPDHPDTLMSMNNLALSYQFAGKLDLALPLFEETLKLMKAKLDPNHPYTLTSMNNLAGGYQTAGKLDLALPLLEETLKLAKAKLGPDQPVTLASMNNLAGGYQTAGKLDLALPLLEETLKLVKAKLGPDHPSTLMSMGNLAGGYQTAGKLDLALPLLGETLKLMKAKLGPDHPDTLMSMNNLAMGYRDAGKPGLALPLFEETLKLRKTRLGPDHPDTLASMNNLAAGYQDAGKPDLALPLLEETLKLRKAKLGHDHPDTLMGMGNLAACYWSLKRLDQSIPLFEEVLRLQEKKLGRGHPDTLMTAANLGVNYKDAGRVAEAVPLLEEAHRVSKEYASLRFVGPQLLDAYAQAGEHRKFAELLREQLPEARRALPKDSPQLAALLAQSGMTLLGMNGFAEAEPLLREALAIREKQEPDGWRTFNTRSMLGGALLGQKKYADAEPLLVKGFDGMKAREKTIPPQAAANIPGALDRLVELYSATKKPNDVKKWQTEREKYPATPATK